MNVSLIIITSLLGIGLMSQIKTTNMAKNTESPSYEILQRYDKFEIRKYPSMILASTKLDKGGYSKNSSKGFRNVANYIFGGNDKKMRISMTSPVMASMGDSMSMSFIMPSKYTLNELPNPNNENVKIKIQDETVVAVISFGGFANDQDIKYHTSILRNKLKENNIDNSGPVYFYGYNPPYQLFNRTNEVAIEIFNYE